MKGGVGFSGQSPLAACRSVWQTPQASVLTRIWPGPGVGMSHSWISSGFLNAVTTAACIFLVDMIGSLSRGSGSGEIASIFD